MSFSVFDYTDYKKYLVTRLPTQGEARGQRARLAGALGCQGAYVSQVLGGATHFSLEHAVLVDEFLRHTGEESRYFLLLVHYGRAGSKRLREYYAVQMSELARRRQVVAERIRGGEAIPNETALTYYHAWYYAAIHVMLLVTRYQTREAIAERLHLPPSMVAEIVDFLVRAGLVQETRGRLKATRRRMHLGQDSVLLNQHHVNWRMQALQSLDRKERRDLHYSGPIALTEENAGRVRAVLLNAIEETEKILERPGEEEVFGVALDFFRL